MTYDFSPEAVMPIIQGLLTSEPREERPLPLLTEQPVISEQPPPESQEQIGGAEMVNKAVASAIPQTPNPYALNMKRDILKAKENYGAAKTDEQRATAQAQAGLLRDIAQAAGIDLSGYGAEDSYADAYKNFYTQQTKDLMEAMTGQYSRNSRQYYNDAYIHSLQNGYSPRKAKMIADMVTGEYQEDRTQYLTGLLNSYGRDGLITNEYGNQFIGALADEGSPLANFYATIYPNAKEAYNRYNTLEDKDIDHSNQVDLLFKGGEVTRANQDNAAKHNIALANNNFRNTLQRDEIQHGYGKENAYDQYRFSTWLARNQGEINKEAARLRADLNLGNLEYLKKLDVDLEDKKFWQGVAQYSKLADYFGYEGERKKAFMEAAFGIKTPDPNIGKFDKASIENGKKLHDMLDADEDKILKQIKDGGVDLEPQEIAELNGKLADIRQFKQQLENIMGEQLGVQSGVQEFSDDETANNETLAYLWSQSNGNTETFRQYVSNWLEASGVTSRFKEEYLKNLKAPK